MVSRDRQVVVEVVPDVKRTHLEPVFRQRVAQGSTVYTDAASCYTFLEEVGYQHEHVNHSAGEYARGEVHENRAENLWSFWPSFILPFRGVAQRNLGAYVKIF